MGKLDTNMAELATMRGLLSASNMAGVSDYNPEGDHEEDHEDESEHMGEGFHDDHTTSPVTSDTENKPDESIVSISISSSSPATIPKSTASSGHKRSMSALSTGSMTKKMVKKFGKNADVKKLKQINKLQRQLKNIDTKLDKFEGESLW